ncbi:MAG: hypothetical protein HQM06_14270 [Magnetococcales bacterium]|nr:hypothetical protein [Magnetococcales bacterium]
MSVLDHLQFRFKAKLQEELQQSRAKAYSVEINGYACHSLRYLANSFPEIGLNPFKESQPPAEQAADEKIYLNLFLLQEAIEAAYLDLYYPNEFHDSEDGGFSAARHAAVVIAWLNRYKPLQVKQGVNETWAVFINSLFALHVGLSLLLRIRAMGGQACELIDESKRFNELIYVLHWRSPDYKQLTTLMQWIC